MMAEAHFAAQSSIQVVDFGTIWLGNAGKLDKVIVALFIPLYALHGLNVYFRTKVGTWTALNTAGEENLPVNFLICTPFLIWKLCDGHNMNPVKIVGAIWNNCALACSGALAMLAGIVAMTLMCIFVLQEKSLSKNMGMSRAVLFFMVRGISYPLQNSYRCRGGETVCFTTSHYWGCLNGFASACFTAQSRTFADVIEFIIISSFMTGWKCLLVSSLQFNLKGAPKNVFRNLRQIFSWYKPKAPLMSDGNKYPMIAWRMIDLKGESVGMSSGFLAFAFCGLFAMVFNDSLFWPTLFYGQAVNVAYVILMFVNDSCTDMLISYLTKRYDIDISAFYSSIEARFAGFASTAQMGVIALWNVIGQRAASRMCAHFRTKYENDAELEKYLAENDPLLVPVCLAN